MKRLTYQITLNLIFVLQDREIVVVYATVFFVKQLEIENKRKFKKQKKKKEETVEKRCTKCFSVIRRGVSHKCVGAVKNISNLVQTLKNKEADHVTSSLLKKKIYTVEETTNADSRIIYLSQTHGKPFKVLIKPPEDQNKTISVEDVSNLQNTFNFSLRTTKGVVSFIRKATGDKQIFETDVIKKLVAKNHDVDNYFQVEKLKFIHVKGTVETSVTEPLVYCNDVMNFITHIKEQRRITDQKVHLKIGTDGGGGFFKVCLSVQLIDSETNKYKKELFKESVFVSCRTYTRKLL